MINKLKRLILENCLDDIYLTGFVDIEDGIAEFYSEKRFLYFKFGDQFIEFESIDQFSRLRISIVNSVRHEFEIDEDMLPGKTRISEVVFKNPLGRCFF